MIYLVQTNLGQPKGLLPTPLTIWAPSSYDSFVSDILQLFTWDDIMTVIAYGDMEERTPRRLTVSTWYPPKVILDLWSDMKVDTLSPDFLRQCFKDWSEYDATNPDLANFRREFEKRWGPL